MFVLSKNETIPIFAISIHIIVLDALPKGMKYNQDYFLSELLPPTDKEKFQYVSQNRVTNFARDIRNSMFHNGSKGRNKLASKHVPQPPMPIILQILVSVTLEV